MEVLRTNQGAPPLLVCVASGLDSPQQRLRWWREEDEEEEPGSHDHSASVWWAGPQQEEGGAYSATSVREASPGAEPWCWTEQRGRSYRGRGC